MTTISRPQADAAPGIPPTAAVLRGRVLMIDDDPSICEAIGSLVETENLEFRACLELDSGREAALGWNPDTLILDLEFPGSRDGGLGLLADLRQAGFDAPVLIFTSEVSVQNVQEAIRFGIFNFLAKPIRPNPFLIALHRALENRRLSRQLAGGPQADPIIGCSPALLELKARLRNVATMDGPVLIRGESGTGKELVCRELHRFGARRDRPLGVVNCAALSPEMIRDELFGHVRGSYTHAIADRRGLATECDGGALFLDEIGLLPLEAQGTVLRFLQEGEVRSIGSNTTRKVDVQVLCATNEPLERLVEDGRFRRDLFERISWFQLVLPPLRDRGADIALLAEHFLLREVKKRNLPFLRLPERLVELLVRHDWPGNVRQLERVVLNLIAHFVHDEDRLGDLERVVEVLPELAPAMQRHPREVRGGDGGGLTREQILPLAEARRVFSRAYLGAAVDAMGGNITQAAKALDVNPSTIHRAFGETVEDEGRKREWVKRGL